MKRIIKMAAAITVALSLFVSCGGGSSSSSSGVSDKAGEGSLPEIAASTVIRNKIVTFGSEEGEYYEYLTFTSETAGSYSLYKVVGSDKVKQLQYNSVDLPDAFTYDATNGKVTTTYGGNSESNYMFNVKKDAGDAFYFATDILENANDEENLFSEWNLNDTSYTFENSGLLTFKTTVSTYKFEFSNDNGFISADGLSFAWVKINDKKNLYVNVYETERETVEAEGRSLVDAEKVISVSSNHSILGLF